MKRNIYSILLLACIGILCSCQENVGPVNNPFDDIDYTGGKDIDIPKPDSASLLGLHTYIFSQSCAVPACHDGSFEPDFRTVQSTYSTLVYQPVVKNDEQGSFQYRVIPGNAEDSWLYFRVTTDNAVIGRMPLYDNALTDETIEALKTWINEGAADIFGNAYALPNTQPRLFTLAAFNRVNTLEFRRDTARADNNPSYPFLVGKDFDLDIWLGIQDDSTAIAELQNTRLLLSDEFDDFSNAVAVTAVYSSTPKMVSDVYSGQGEVGLHWKVEIPASMPLPATENGITFFRFYTQDGDHLEEVEFPTNAQPAGLKFFMSFARF